MCTRCLPSVALVVCALFCAPRISSAVNPIPIVNAGFELPGTYQNFATDLNGTPIPGWNFDDITAAGVWNPSIDSFGGLLPPAPEGLEVMYLGYNAPNHAEQQLDQVLAPNATYTLTGKVADVLGYPADWTAELTAGGNILGTATGNGPEGAFTTFTINFNSAGSPYVGQVLQIVLGTDTTQTAYDDIKLTTSAPVVAGDLNADGLVNITDYNILKGNWLKTADFLAGDLNHDGTVNLFDFGIFKTDYHLFNGGAGASLPSSVPEPSTWLLATMALSGLVLARRRAVRNKT